jgi:adenine deaminase
LENNSFTVRGQFIDILNKEIYPSELSVADGKILRVERLNACEETEFILPGFVDAHVHIESSMLIPAEFARLAVVHGTVGTVSDPHEIANVCGRNGVNYMVNNGKQVPFKFNFGVPSCVPATIFETAGDELRSEVVEEMLGSNDFLYLSEMMNFPGVLHQDSEVMAKITAAHAAGKPVDGHAPGLRGDAAKQYIDAGISTDHECFTGEEALDKLQYGMKILIREGSAAKNFEALVSLIDDYPSEIMFCSDDKHPDSLVESHINQLCARAVAKNLDLFNVLRAACINPVEHYRLPIGLLKEGDPADFILIKDVVDFEVVKTFIDGKLVAENGRSLIESSTDQNEPINRFACEEKTLADFAINHRGNYEAVVIEALDGQLITNRLSAILPTLNGEVVSDPAKDILKIVVVNRYENKPVAKAFIHRFGLKTGAIASSVAHDSHNIVAVGIDDESICEAVNLVIRAKGGVSAAAHYGQGFKTKLLPLPVAGLMSASNGYEVAEAYTAIDAMAKEMGSALSAPFMTLSFMALLVIPRIKLSDKGLFDGDNFSFIG